MEIAKASLVALPSGSPPGLLVVLEGSQKELREQGFEAATRIAKDHGFAPLWVTQMPIECLYGQHHRATYWFTDCLPHGTTFCVECWPQQRVEDEVLQGVMYKELA